MPSEIPPKPWFRRLRLWHVVLYGLIIAMFVISGIVEYNSRSRQVISLLENQARITATAIARSGREQVRLTEDLRTSFIQRAFDLLHTVNQLDQSGILTPERLNELSGDTRIFRILVIDSRGQLELEGGPDFPKIGPGHRRGMRYGLIRRLAPVIEGRQDSVVIGLGGGMMGRGPMHMSGMPPPEQERFLVAIRRSQGGAVATQLTVEAEAGLRSRLDIEQTLQELIRGESIAYLILKQGNTEPIFISSKLKSLATLDRLNERRVDDHTFWREGQIGSYIEVETPLQIDPQPGMMKIGFTTAQLEELRQQVTTQILIRSGLFSLLAVLVFMFTLTRQNALLLEQEKERIQEEVTRLERLTRVQEKQAAMGELAAGVAHEIRNPLNAIGILAQRLKWEFTPTQDDVDEYVSITETMHQEIKRINKSLEYFLDYSKPIPLKPNDIDLSPIIRDLETLYSEEIREAGLQLDMDIPDKLPLRADRDYIKQALSNLLRNAVEHTPSGGKINLRATATVDGIQISIRDTGEGISTMDQQRIFDLFYSTKDMGHGVGLAITHKIITDHGGTIEVRSNQGEGATFIVNLSKKPPPTDDERESRS